MNTQMKTVSLLFSFILLLAHGALAATGGSAEDIAVLANSVPEFRTDPHAKELQGNQVSRVVRTILRDQRGRLDLVTGLLVYPKEWAFETKEKE